MKKRANEYKYKLHYLINRLPGYKYRHAQKFIAAACGVRPSTVKRWIYIKADDGATIPGDALLKIARLFNVHPDELLTNEIINSETINTQFELFCTHHD